MAAHLPLELLPQGLIWNDDVGCLEPRKVEGLAGGGADDGPLGDVLSEGGQHRMPVSGHDEVIVDLIAADQHAVVQADLGHALQLLRRPDPAEGIVGTAQDEQRRLWVPGLGLEIRPIHVVNA